MAMKAVARLQRLFHFLNGLGPVCLNGPGKPVKDIDEYAA
jgi:hypothetical protein